MKLSLVLLTRNEIHGLMVLFDRIPFAKVEEAFAVDGGSTDGTLEFYRTRNFPVVPQYSSGRGEAFRIAFTYARGDAVIIFSPDGNEDPGDIPKFRPLLEQGNDIVIATRMAPGAHNEEDELRFPWRKWANQAFTLLANCTWNRGQFLTDSINGFRAITRKAWEQLALDGIGYTIEYQSSIRAMKLGLRIAEFPTHESNRIGPGGSPSFASGLAFLNLYAHELRIGRRFLPGQNLPSAKQVSTKSIDS